MRLMALLIVASMAFSLPLTGCDRDVSETSHTKVDSNGNVTKESKTVTETPGGDVTVTKEKSEKTVNQ